MLTIKKPVKMSKDSRITVYKDETRTEQDYVDVENGCIGYLLRTFKEATVEEINAEAEKIIKEWNVDFVDTAFFGEETGIILKNAEKDDYKYLMVLLNTDKKKIVIFLPTSFDQYSELVL